MSLLPLFVAAALAQDPSTLEAEAEVITVGDHPVGAEIPFTVTFRHTAGEPVTVSGFDLVNQDGQAFTFDGPAELSVPEGGSAQLGMLFRPIGEGEQTALLTVQSDADCALPATVLLRGTAYEPCVIATPQLMDFGPIGPPRNDVQLVTLQSCDGRTHRVDTTYVSNPRYTLAIPPTFDITPSGATVSVEFTPIDTTAQSATLTIGSWETTIQLVANDCYAGDPANFDSDGDGTSDCGIPVGGMWVDGDGDGFTGADGDCRDSDPDVYPGAPEVDGGIDDNCDGQIDEHKDLDRDGAPASQDCDESDPWVHVGEDEVLDGLDNDCDGETDEGLEPATCGGDDGEGDGKDGCGCATGGPSGGWLALSALALLRRR